jgi:hypothetical protein
MIGTLKSDNLIRVYVKLWAIWHARRKAIHKQVFQSPLFIHHFVDSFVSDLKQTEEGVGKKMEILSSLTLTKLRMQGKKGQREY